MTRYNVHIYSEMRLVFERVEADSHEAAASIARDKPTGDADDIVDCNGDDLTALVDVAEDEDFSRSVTIDFEPERQRKAGPRLLTALKAILPYAENEQARLSECWRRDGEAAVEAVADACGQAIDLATTAIAEAKAAEVTPAPAAGNGPRPRFRFTHEPEENPDRAYVLVDGRIDVAIDRTAEGIVIKVFPDDWIDPFDTLTVWDEEIAELEQAAAEGS